MNFIEGLFYPPPAHLSIGDQVQWKKERLDLTVELTTHKLALAFFLDIDSTKCPKGDKAALDSLSHFEWYAGSLTAKRLYELLTDFLEDPSAKTLTQATRHQIALVIACLKETHESSSLIDLSRSKSLSLALLVRTGISFLSNYSSIPDERIIQELTNRALQRISTLQVGETAFFLLGTLNHETMLSVRFVNREQWEVCYHDTATEKRLFIYSANLTPDTPNLLQTRPFWEQLYRYKFIGGSSEKVQGLFAQLAPYKGDTILYSTVSKQKRNTCHFRCLLGLLKDHIIRQSGQKLDIALIEWSCVKAYLGQCLLDKGHITDPTLLAFAKVKQNRRQEKATRMRTLLEESDLSPHVEACQKAGALLDPNEPYLIHNSWLDKLPQVIQLKFLNQTLFSRLEKSLLTPDQLKVLFKTIDNAWVAHTCQMYINNYATKSPLFRLRLEHELADATSALHRGFEEFKLSSISRLNQVDYEFSCLLQQLGLNYSRIYWSEETVENAEYVSLPTEVLDHTLQQLIKEPQALTRLYTRPCLNKVLLQAVQAGKFAEIDFLYQHMNEEDRNAFHVLRQDHHFVWSLLLPKVEDYLIQNPTTSYLRIAVIELYTMAIRERNFEKFFSLYKILNIDLVDLNKLCDLIGATQLPVTQIWNTLVFLEEDQGKKISGALLICVARTLLSEESFDRMEIFSNSAKFDQPAIRTMLNTVQVSLHYRQGEFGTILQLFDNPLFDISNNYLKLHGYSFSLNNLHIGIRMLQKSTLPKSFKQQLVGQLLINSHKNQSKEMALSVVDADYLASDASDFESILRYLSFDTILFTCHALIQNAHLLHRDETWRNRILHPVLEELVTRIDLDIEKSFLEVNELIEQIAQTHPEWISAFFTKERFFYDRLEKFLEAYPKTLLSKRSILQQLPQILDDAYIKHRRTRTLTDPPYINQRTRFLKLWKLVSPQFDSSNLKCFYQEMIKPIFGNPTFLSRPNYREILNDFLPHLTSPHLKTGIALFYWEIGEREIACQFDPQVAEHTHLLV
jgi:hypothetical protein